MDNYFLELKIKELDLLNVKYIFQDGILAIKDKTISLVGCDVCYMKKAIANTTGYVIDAGPLIRFSEKFTRYSEKYPVLANNCWLCPKCNRVFKELLPEFDFTVLKNNME